jgi:hypothetical protein
MLSLGAVPKPELTHQDQAELKIPEHRVDLAILPDPDNKGPWQHFMPHPAT